jgi:hypothetical protein
MEKISLPEITNKTHWSSKYLNELVKLNDNLF